MYNSMRFEACVYKGNRWGIYCYGSKCFTVLGKKKNMIAYAKRLNEMEVI